MIYKQDAKKGQGSCIAIQWAPKSVDGKEYFLISGFGSGQVISSVFSNNSIFPISEISIGAPVRHRRFKILNPLCFKILPLSTTTLIC